MSSLLQFNGRIGKRGVYLQFTHEKERTDPSQPGWLKTMGNGFTDCIYLPNGKVLPRIWTAPRVPCGMFGCWVVFRYNGKEHVPDLSVPIAVDKLPRGARPLPIDECLKQWQT